LVVIHRGKQ